MNLDAPTFTFRHSPALEGQSVTLRPVDWREFFEATGAQLRRAFLEPLSESTSGGPPFSVGIASLLVDMVNAGIASGMQLHFEGEQLPRRADGLPLPGHVSVEALDLRDFLSLVLAVTGASPIPGEALERAAALRGQAARRMPDRMPGREALLSLVERLAVHTETP